MQALPEPRQFCKRPVLCWETGRATWSIGPWHHIAEVCRELDYPECVPQAPRACGVPYLWGGWCVTRPILAQDEAMARLQKHSQVAIIGKGRCTACVEELHSPGWPLIQVLCLLTASLLPPR